LIKQNLSDDGLGKKGLGLNAFANRSGLSVAAVKKLCEQGSIPSASKHPITGKWWVYPPLKIPI